MKNHRFGTAAFKGTIAAAVLAGLCAAGVRAADTDTGKQVIDYYRRKANLPPEIEASLTNVTDSKIPGAKSATLELKRGAQTQNVDILMSPDGRYVVFGEVEDVTSDPFAEIAKKITLKDSPRRGPADAKVVIVEFSDFQCPYCARAHDTVANQVMKEYEGKVALVYKNFPLGFHKWAEPAAIAGECAFQQDPDSFWKLYDFYFANQKDFTPENIKEKTLAELDGTKVDKEKFTDCYDNKKTVDLVRGDMAEGQQVGVTGTPAFMINGRKLSGAQPFDRFKAIIDDELQRSGS